MLINSDINKDGIIVVDKPKSVSSAQCISKIKKILNVSKIGHMGTLDPLASGVLIAGIGKGTKLFDVFLGHNKEYIADFRFGYDTDTLDITGRIVSETKNIPNSSDIIKTIPKMCGVINQVPPQYSAKSVGGVKAYKVARLGGSLALPPKQVTIYKLDYIKKLDSTTHRIFVKCSSGTYIRSICRDLAELLGTKASLSDLRRISSGKYNINESYSMDCIDNSSVIPLDNVLNDFVILNVHDDYFYKVINGGRLPICIFGDLDISLQYVLKCKGHIIGIATIVDNSIAIKTYLYSGMKV